MTIKKEGETMTVAQRLKKIRKKHGLSQKAVAELIGVSPGAVCRWEKGEREISDWAMKAYSAAFHVPETYFLNIERKPGAKQRRSNCMPNHPRHRTGKEWKSGCFGIFGS